MAQNETGTMYNIWSRRHGPPSSSRLTTSTVPVSSPETQMATPVAVVHMSSSPRGMSGSGQTFINHTRTDPDVANHIKVVNAPFSEMENHAAFLEQITSTQNVSRLSSDIAAYRATHPAVMPTERALVSWIADEAVTGRLTALQSMQASQDFVHTFDAVCAQHVADHAAQKRSVLPTADTQLQWIRGGTETFVRPELVTNVRKVDALLMTTAPDCPPRMVYGRGLVIKEFTKTRVAVTASNGKYSQVVKDQIQMLEVVPQRQFFITLLFHKAGPAKKKGSASETAPSTEPNEKKRSHATASQDDDDEYLPPEEMKKKKKSGSRQQEAQSVSAPADDAVASFPPDASSAASPSQDASHVASPDPETACLPVSDPAAASETLDEYECDMVVTDHEVKRYSRIHDCFDKGWPMLAATIGVLTYAGHHRLGFMPPFQCFDDVVRGTSTIRFSADETEIAFLPNDKPLTVSLSSRKNPFYPIFGRSTVFCEGTTAGGQMVAVKWIYADEKRKTREYDLLRAIMTGIEPTARLPDGMDREKLELGRKHLPTLFAAMIFPRQSWQASRDQLERLRGMLHGEPCIPRNLTVFAIEELAEPYEPIPKDDWQVSSRRLARLMAELVGALRWLFSRQIMHRDISWSNVMVYQGRIMLIDYDCGAATRRREGSSMSPFELTGHVDCMAIDLMKVLTSAHVRQVGSYNHLGRYDLESVLYLFIYVLAQNLHDDSAKEALFGCKYETVKDLLDKNHNAIRDMKNGWDFRACAIASRYINLNIYGDCATLMESLHRLRLDGLHSQDTRRAVLVTAEPSPSQADVNRRLAEQDSDDHFWSLSERLQTAFEVYAASTPRYDDTTQAVPALIES